MISQHPKALFFALRRDNSWGKETMKKYTLPSNEPQLFGFIITPVPAR